jgi:Na+(H+)/acetate symporter ActP
MSLLRGTSFEEQQEHQMSKYAGFIIIAVFLLSILLGVFWNQIIQSDAIADAVALIFGLVCLFIIVRGLLTKRVDWSKPNVFIRPFLPPLGGETPHRLTDRDEVKSEERPEE